jgi:hypothetical protein
MYDYKKNVAIASYYPNLQNILNSSKKTFIKWRIDWLIYNLVGIKDGVIVKDVGTILCCRVLLA